VNDDLGVARGLKQAAAPHQLAAQLVGIGQIAVVAERQPAELEIGEERLDVALERTAMGRVADMTDGAAARQPDSSAGCQVARFQVQAATY